MVSVNRSYDSNNLKGELIPFLTGVSGWDPVDMKFKFLDFSRDGMMIEGTIELIDNETILYDFKFSVPGNKRKLTGRDLLEFNTPRNEFTWSSYYKLPNGDFNKLNELVMIRGEDLISY